MTNIDASVLATVVGGKAAATPTKPAAPKQPDASQIGTSAIQGCLTGAAGSIGKSPEQAAIGCAIGAGKSIFDALGKSFGSSTGAGT